MKRALTAVLTILSFHPFVLAGDYSCDSLSVSCQEYLDIKNANPTDEFTLEMEACNGYIFGTDQKEIRRCNYCQVISDLEDHGSESEIPNLGFFNSFRPDWNVSPGPVSRACD